MWGRDLSSVQAYKLPKMRLFNYPTWLHFLAICFTIQLTVNKKGPHHYSVKYIYAKFLPQLTFFAFPNLYTNTCVCMYIYTHHFIKISRANTLWVHTEERRQSHSHSPGCASSSVLKGFCVHTWVKTLMSLPASSNSSAHFSWPPSTDK